MPILEIALHAIVLNRTIGKNNTVTNDSYDHAWYNMSSVAIML